MNILLCLSVAYLIVESKLRFEFDSFIKSMYINKNNNFESCPSCV
jgi:hypothetical protein